MNRAALWECLDSMASAVLAPEGSRDAEAFWLDASLAAGDAAPLDSGLSEALGVILARIGPLAAGSEAAA